MTIAGNQVSGTLTGTGVIGPYQPFSNQPFNVFITGTFVGTVELQRSNDGVNYLTITAPDWTAQAIFGAPVTFVAKEPDAAVLYQLNCTSYTSGSISGRIG